MPALQNQVSPLPTLIDFNSERALSASARNRDEICIVTSSAEAVFMVTRPTLALVAHDAKKDTMVSFAQRNEDKLKDYDLVATGTTGGRIADACPTLNVTRLKSGPLGGDQQIGALIAEGRLQGLIFFVDPLSPMPHDVDVKALMRLALVYDMPMALNLATAEILLRSARLSGLKTTSATPEIRSV